MGATLTPVLSLSIMMEFGPLLLRTELRRAQAIEELDPTTRSDRGQFFTRADVAAFLASLFELPNGPIRLLDPGAGVGSLTAAVIDRCNGSGLGPVSVTAVEVDEKVRQSLSRTLDDATKTAESFCELVAEDFTEWGVEHLMGFAALNAEPFDLVVMNPPYRKIGVSSKERQRVERLGVEVSNLYAAFMTIAIRLLRPGGQLVAITPRSFANGPYFRSFRTDFLQHMALRRLHVYDARDSAFATDNVLQENLILHAVRDGERRSVFVTSSAAVDDDYISVREVPYGHVVDEADREQFIHLTVDQTNAEIATRLRTLEGSLAHLNVGVSTGKVVDFRTRENLRKTPAADTVPLIYPMHFSEGKVQWPILGGRKPNALVSSDSTASLLLPNGHYVLVKRFSSKEERRRVVAVVSAPHDVPSDFIAFENHINVYHRRNEGMPAALAHGLACFLNSTPVDLYVRQFSGHTQVNATDLRRLPYPTIEQLVRLGDAAGEGSLSQGKIDELVVEHIVELRGRDGGGPLVLHKKITEAQEVLRQLGLPKAQTNERSALTLLALLDLMPDRAWPDAQNPRLGITPMMNFMAANYGKHYAPNSRETVRRQTVHQFVEAGVAVINPDDPGRPTNSGATVYQVPDELLTILHSYGTPDWSHKLAKWREIAPTLIARWAKTRELSMVPVSLPNGQKVALSPGGQNPLIKAIVEEFCPRFAPGGHVLYIGDTGDKFVVWEKAALEALGISINEKGKMPDVVVHDYERGWLLLIEAVTSHGPVDPKRQGELSDLFGECEAGLVYVTAFKDRRALAHQLPHISWETEVWIAEDPTHMIHFNGVRFLGPYES